MDETSVKQKIIDIQQLLRPISELSAYIITQAELQSYTEDMYNQLVQLAYEGIGFLEELQEGQVITGEWLAKRDDLVARAQHLILDAPNAPDA